jgi:hypothetical protein
MAAADSAAASLAAAALSDAAAAPPPAAAAVAAPTGEAAPTADQVVTPWDVQGGAGGIDYDKLLTTFGCQPINAELIARCAACRARRLRPCRSRVQATECAPRCRVCARQHRARDWRQSARAAAPRHVLCAQARGRACALPLHRAQLGQAAA